MKHKKFTMIVALVLVVALAAGLGIWATGEEKLPTVTYYDGNDGNNARFAFTNTGKGSATDLFANFSNCMPGDSLTQTICVKADSANGAQGGAAALVIVTEWKEFRSPDFTHLAAALRTPVIFDGRNLFEPADMRALGLEYHPIGRTAP